MLRPASTRWFEVLCPRRDSVRTTAALARTGAIEVEVRARAAQVPVPHQDLSRLEEYRKQLPRYERYWARGHLHARPLTEAPGVALERALARIAAWQREADPRIAAIQAGEEELARLRWLARLLVPLRDSLLDFDRVTCGGPVLGTFCAILPREAEPRLPEPMLVRVVPGKDECGYLVLGPVEALAPARLRIQAVKGRILEHPAWLRGDAAAALAQIEAQREFLATRIIHLYAELDTLFEEFDLGAVLGEGLWLDWFTRHVGGLELASEHLVWITGWTDDLSGATLIAALERAETPALLRFAPPPADARPPQVLDNPPWLKPFEAFALALGVPGGDEVDPTPLLALLVPLLFGYMFGDVGQGAVLVALGWALRSRFALAPLLISGGLSAIFFGLLFGSLFALEHRIPALWLSPLEEPLTVLLVPLLLAVLLLSLGQLLAGLSALWRGDLERWLAVDTGLLLLYLGLAGLAMDLPSEALAGLGMLWYLGGNWWLQRRVLGALAALGPLLESSLQLLVNTLSFARVGAFALAHAALSAAVVTLAEAMDSTLAWGLLLVLGNLLIIGLEGLVVSIQTTRLVLFEFFNRFLVGRGRVFRPLPAPALGF